MRFSYFFETLGLQFFFGLSKLIGVRAGSYCGSLLGLLASKILAERKTALRNIQNALPHLSDQQQKDILAQNGRQSGRMFGEWPHLEQLSNDRERLRFIGKENVQAALDTGKAALFVSAHLSNWELAVAGLRQLVDEFGITYRVANNPYSEKWIHQRRGAFAAYQIPKGRSGARQMINLIKQNIPLTILIDHWLNAGDPIAFFGRPTRAPSAAVKLARRFELPIVPTLIRRRTDAPDAVYFEQVFFPPIYVAKSDNQRADIDATMRVLYDMLETWISERPEEWLWAHRRWRD